MQSNEQLSADRFFDYSYYDQLVQEYGLIRLHRDDQLLVDHGYITESPPLVVKGTPRAVSLIMEDGEGRRSIEEGCLFLITRSLLGGRYQRIELDGQQVPIIMLNTGLSFWHEYIHYWIDTINPELFDKLHAAREKMGSKGVIGLIEEGSLTYREIEQEFCFHAVHEGIAGIGAVDLEAEVWAGKLHFMSHLPGFDYERERQRMLRNFKDFFGRPVLVDDLDGDLTYKFGFIKEFIGLIASGSLDRSAVEDLRERVPANARLMSTIGKMTTPLVIDPKKELRGMIEGMWEGLTMDTFYPTKAGKHYIGKGLDLLQRSGYTQREAMVMIIKNPPERLADLINIEAHLQREFGN